jgi:fatty acid synthase
MDMEISGTLPQRINSCLEVLDKLLTIENEPVVATMVVAEKKQDDSKKGNIIDVIMSIMSIRDRKQVSMESTLSKLGMDSLMGVEILQVLERDFDLVIASQVLRSLTLSQLEKLVASKSSVPVDSEISLKIEKLLTSFGDEKNAEEIILKLNEWENGKKILIVPGFEGMASDVWFEFGKKLKNPTFALQLTSTYEKEDLEKIFDGVKNVRKIFKSI